MLRTAVSVSAAAFVAALALSACAPVRMGAAAIVGNDRISNASLAAQVSDLQQQLGRGTGGVQLAIQKSQATQDVLAWLVRFRIRERLGQREHVAVTPSQRQQALSQIAASFRQGGLRVVHLGPVLSAYGVPPDQLSEIGRYQAIQNEVINRLDGGVTPTSQSAIASLGAKFNHAECLAAKSLKIQLNPQFGQLDYNQFSVIPATTTLSTPQVPGPKPTSAPLLTPPC